LATFFSFFFCIWVGRRGADRRRGENFLKLSSLFLEIFHLFHKNWVIFVSSNINLKKVCSVEFIPQKKHPLESNFSARGGAERRRRDKN
jgi:hypothetical protein